MTQWCPEVGTLLNRDLLCIHHQWCEENLVTSNSNVLSPGTPDSPLSSLWKM